MDADRELVLMPTLFILCSTVTCGLSCLVSRYHRGQTDDILTTDCFAVGGGGPPNNQTYKPGPCFFSPSLSAL